MAANNHPHHHNEVDSLLKKQVKEISDQLQKEMKRLQANLSQADGNPALYSSLAKQIQRIQEETNNQDIISALNTASDSLKKAEELAKSHGCNKDILTHLQTANSELFKSKNIRG